MIVLLITLILIIAITYRWEILIENLKTYGKPSAHSTMYGLLFDIDIWCRINENRGEGG